MYGNYFPYGQFGTMGNSMVRGMMPNMARAGGAFMGNAANIGNTAIRNPGLLSNLFSSIKSLNWGGLLTNTQKTLGIVNQAIPVYHQVRPLYDNVKTAARVFKSVSKSNKEESINNVTKEKSVNTVNNTKPTTNTNNNSSNGPNFFL